MEKEIDEKNFVVGITASGETPFVFGCVTAAKERWAATAAVTTNPQAIIVQMVDSPIVPLVGLEVILGYRRTVLHGALAEVARGVPGFYQRYTAIWRQVFVDLVPEIEA